MASLVIDIVLILISVILLIKYTKKGFVKTVLDIAKTVLSIVLAFCLRKPVGKLIDSAFMNSAITNWVRNSLFATANGENNFVDFVSIYEDMPSFYTNILTKFGLDLETVQEYITNFQNASNDEINELAVNIGSSVSMMLSVIVAVLVVFIVSIIILTIVVHLLNLLTKFSAINFVNRLLGFLFGAVIAVLIMWLASLAVGLLIEFIGPMKPDIFNDDLIEKSVILKFFSEHNLYQMVMELIEK